MFELDEKNYFTLLLIIPLLAVGFVAIQIWKKRKQNEFGSHAMLTKLAPDLSTFKPLLKFILVCLSLVCLVVALVNPMMGTTMKTVKKEGIDVVFAIDVSKSMLAEDVAPNRLERSKQIVSQLINKLGTDRVGIIAYSGSAFPVLPITTDYSVARMFLQSMSTTTISSQGTSIDEAITLSAQFFDKKSTTRKLLVILSDGEDHSDNAESAAEKIKDSGVKIITVGVGTEKGERIPIKENGMFVGFQTDKEDQIVVTKRNTKVLESIAKATEGYYIDGNDTKSVVGFIDGKIKNSDKTEFESMRMTNFDSQFQWFLGAALLFLLADTFMSERKTKWLRKLNLFNEKEA